MFLWAWYAAAVSAAISQPDDCGDLPSDARPKLRDVERKRAEADGYRHAAVLSRQWRWRRASLFSVLAPLWP
ncbi:hypothetical protein KCP70_24425 [Salmonella enterica subsp. enterica]|nr:hypothetical protein KCP70_24425 [Salmonella enterica subsp. enterica]